MRSRRYAAIATTGRSLQNVRWAPGARPLPEAGQDNNKKLTPRIQTA